MNPIGRQTFLSRDETRQFCRQTSSFCKAARVAQDRKDPPHARQDLPLPCPVNLHHHNFSHGNEIGWVGESISLPEQKTNAVL
ncbi:Hypothetical protein NTJ_00950 [Nesidiocoris tenuis]|uniref:Uncharacterized protein n=1 Tax=Nesidiocoris tenuis TaxID=355587 RepID=A0ABN7AA93_9HEMI|nr:Hypothetical protein NTJ_00950 [Nesidiocoris tenuis]